MVLALFALSLAATPAANEPVSRAPAVSLDLSALKRPLYDRLSATDLYKTLLVQLVAENLAVTGSGEKVDVAVRIAEGSAKTLLVFATTSSGVSQAELNYAGLDSSAMSMRLAHAVIALIREAVVTLDRTPSRPTPPDPLPKVETRAHSWLWPEEAAVAFVWDPRAAGVMPSFKWAVAGEGRLDWTWSLGVDVPVGLDSRLHLVEPWIAAGLRVSPTSPISNWTWTTSASLGAWQHVYWYRGSYGGHDSGVRVEPFALCDAQLAYRLSEAWAVGLSAGVIATLRGRQHRVDDQVLWRAPNARATAGLAITYRPADVP